MVTTIDALKVVYCPVPKAACSSVKAALAKLDPDSDVPADIDTNPDAPHGVYPTRRFAWHRYEPYSGEGWFRFTVVRDPLERCLSAFRDRVVKRRELTGCRAVRRGLTDLPPVPDPDTFFQNIDAYLELSSSLQHHFMRTRYFTGIDLDRFHKVYRMDELAELENDLSEYLNKPVSLGRSNASSKNTSLALADLQPASVRVLKRFLRRDYKHLAAFYPSPF